MDAIRRARRLSRLVLNVVPIVLWLQAGVTSMVGVTTHRLSWWLLVPALIAGVLFTWLYLRITEAIMEDIYLSRETVVAGILALIAAVLGGADAFGWGMMPVGWLSVAAVGLTGRKALLLGVATFAGVSGLSALALLAGRSALGLEGPVASAIIVSTLFYAIMCAALPPGNRLWAWIWRLARDAHDGREAHGRLAVAEERLRFARDLHDLVGHQLSAIAVKAELAVRLAEEGPSRTEMAEVNALTRQALRELREAVRGYRELDLSAELSSVKGVLEAAGVRCELHLPYRDLPGELAPVFAYAVREAVTNVLKHSTATFCDITLRFTGDEAELVVRNDGVARRQAADLGSGLTGMGERLAAVGGKITARPTEDGEFVLNAVVSLPIRG